MPVAHYNDPCTVLTCDRCGAAGPMIRCRRPVIATLLAPLYGWSAGHSEKHGASTLCPQCLPIRLALPADQPWIERLRPDSDDIKSGRGALSKHEGKSMLLLVGQVLAFDGRSSDVLVFLDTDGSLSLSVDGLRTPVYRVSGGGYGSFDWGQTGDFFTKVQDPCFDAGQRTPGRFSLDLVGEGAPDTVTIARLACRDERAVSVVARVTNRGDAAARASVSLVFENTSVSPHQTAEVTIWCHREQDMAARDGEVFPSPPPDPRRALYAVIEQDEDCPSPGDWETPVEFAIGPRCPIRFGDISKCYRDNETRDAHVAKVVKEQGVAVPLFLYSHGGYRLFTNRTCRWDSGQIGWAVLTKAQCKSLSRGRKISDWQKDGEAAIRSTIAVWDQYFTGDVYRLGVFNALGEEIDACGGFYGQDAVREEAQRYGLAKERIFEL